MPRYAKGRRTGIITDGDKSHEYYQFRTREKQTFVVFLPTVFSQYETTIINKYFSFNFKHDSRGHFNFTCCRRVKHQQLYLTTKPLFVTHIVNTKN